jgi:hypothetical protein
VIVAEERNRNGKEHNYEDPMISSSVTVALFYARRLTAYFSSSEK